MASGSDVRNTIQTSGLISTLLAPFIHFAVLKTEQKTGMQLGTGYEAQVLMGIGALIQFGAAHYRVTQTTQEPPQ